MPEAARVDDEITHSQAGTGLGLGMLGGAVLGAVVGVALLGVATVATIFTAGAALPALIMVGCIFTGAFMGGRIGEIIGRRQTVPRGKITSGETNIFINGKWAATCGSLVACQDHGPTVQVAQGSATVFFNGYPAARVGDKGTCGFKIGKGCEHVFIGGDTGGCGLTVGDEVSGLLRDLHAATGVIGSTAFLLSGIGAMWAGGVSVVGIGVRLLVAKELTEVADGVGREIGGDIGEGVDRLLGGDGSFGRELGGELGGDAAQIGAGYGMGRAGLFRGPGNHGNRNPLTRPTDPTFKPRGVERVQATRERLGMEYPEKNMAHGELQTSGGTRTYDTAVSGKKTPQGTLPETGRYRDTTRPLREPGQHSGSRAHDSEVKILENAARDLEGNPNAEGTLRIYSERQPCTSCRRVIRRFESEHPNVKVEVDWTHDAAVPPAPPILPSPDDQP